MTEEFDYKLELLKQEMEISQDGIKTYNEAQFKVKSFAIPLLAGFLTFAMDKQRPIFLLSGIVIVILFWFQDAYFQSIQRVYMERAREIEAIFLSTEFSEAFTKHSFSDLKLKGEPVQFLSIETRCINWEKNKFRETLDRLFSLQNFGLYVPLLALVVVLWSRS